MTDEFATYDAAYVLGALSPPDRQAFEAHLRTCAACATAVAELAGVPGLLARVSRDDAQEITDAGEHSAAPLPETLLPRLQGTVRFRRRRRALLQAAAAVLVAVACLALGLWIGRPAPPAAAQQPQEVVALQATAAVPVDASVSLQDKAWGTELKLRCAYHDSSGSYPEHYQLWVVGDDGTGSEAAGWKTAAGVPVMNITGATSLTRQQIATIEVRGENGEVLLAGRPG